MSSNDQPGRGPKRAPGRGGTILLVDDEAAVRAVARAFLGLQGFAVLEAADGAEALRVAEHHPGPIDLLIADVEMPGLDGRALAQTLGPLRPGMRVLYLSGYPRDAALAAGKVPAGAEFLEKPFSAAGLGEK